MKPRVLVISSANLDLVQRMSRLPEPGETVIEPDTAFTYLPGGKGTLSAATFARMGADCVFCTRLGQDSGAARLLRVYEKEGIDTRFVVADKTLQTGLASILTEEGKPRRTLVYPGAWRALSPADVEEAMTCLPDAVYLQLEVPEDAALAAAYFAGQKKIPLFVDAGPARADFPLDKLGRVEIFSPNEEETFVYTGIRPDGAESCLRACIRLSSLVSARHIVLKLGRRGCYVYDGKFFHVIPALPVTEEDPTGAGDVFTAALTWSYMQEHSAADAARYACYAAALCVSRAGGYPSVPTLEETLRFLREQGT